MSTVQRTLEVVRTLLDGPCRWVQRSFALNAYGQPVAPESLDAFAFCLTGAVARASVALATEDRVERVRLYEGAVRALLPAIADRVHPSVMRARKYQPAPVQVMAFNDSAFTTHSDVLAVLDQTLARMTDDETETDQCV